MGKLRIFVLILLGTYILLVSGSVSGIGKVYAVPVVDNVPVSKTKHISSTKASELISKHKRSIKNI